MGKKSAYGFRFSGDLLTRLVSQLITIKKVTTEKYPSPFDQHFVTQEDLQVGESEHVPSHKDFREKYFKGFKKDERADEGSPEQDPK